jgi:phosphohistidine phosphatase
MDREEWRGNDADRPLTEKGIKRTKQAARGLLSLGIAPTHLLTSPLVRAQETARLLQEVFKDAVAVSVCDELLPGAPPDKMLPLLEGLPPDACVICVGHEPRLGEAAGLLLFGKPVAGLSLKKAGACFIEMPVSVKAGRGRLHWWLTPAQLRTLGKAGGSEAD